MSRPQRRSEANLGAPSDCSVFEMTRLVSSGLFVLVLGASRHFSVSTAYAHFSIGSFLMKASPPGRNVDYVAVWTTYKS
jgi:hypothetical protein